MSNLTVIQEDIGASLASAGIESVLPDHIKIDSFVRCAAVAVASNKDLIQADRDSLVMSLTTCATDGLVPDGKEAALVTFNVNAAPKGQPKQWVKKVQYLPMVFGVMKKARMSGQIAKLGCKAVFEGDEFDYWMDEDGEHFKYRPMFQSDVVVKAFAFAKLTNGEMSIEVMSKNQIDKVRASSKTGTYGPWADWYDRMACKAVFHRLARILPNASEIIEMCEQGMNMSFDARVEKEIQPVVNNPKDKLKDLLKDKEPDKYLPWLKVESLDDVTEVNAAAAVLKLEKAL